MNLYAGTFDYIVFGTILILNVFLWKKQTSIKIGCITAFIVLGVLLPLTSMAVEMNSYREFAAEKPFDDGFEMFYTLYRIPLYWSLGILQSLVFVIKYRFKKVKEN